MRALLALLMASASASAAAVPAMSSTPIPTHCRANEFAVLDARMMRVVESPTAPIRFVPTGKVLSLCADKPHEPFGRLDYRFGPVGAVEFERQATRDQRFGLFSEATSPHTGENSVTFVVGGARFRVSIATNQGNGVWIVVHEGSKVVTNLFSGNDVVTDFRLGPAQIDFERVSSPIFMLRDTRGF